MRNFAYLQPTSLAEASQLLSEYGEEAKVFAGGTSLLILMKEGLLRPSALVNIKRIPGLNFIRHQPGVGLRIGALTRHRAIELSPEVRAMAPALAHMEQDLANVRMRNLGTIGGSISFAEPQSDPPALLVALGAKVKIYSAPGEREVAIEDFFVNYYETVIGRGEIVSEVIVPDAPRGSGAAYVKLPARTACDKPAVGAAAFVNIDGDGAIVDARVVLGAVGPAPLRARSAEAHLVGKTPSAETTEEAAEIAGSECDPADDLYGSSWYKKEMARSLSKRAINLALAEAKQRG